MNNSTTTDVILQDVFESNQGKWQHLDWLQGINNSANIPSFVLLSVLTICGVFGNSLILMVYSRKVNKTPTVTLIQVIAFVDLMTNLFIIPGTIYTILHTVTYTNVIVCKGYYFLNSFTAWTSAVLLVIVAIIRYRKICRPFGRQITIKEARVICACAMGLSLLFSIPFGVLYGLVVSKTGLPDTYKYNCGIADQYSGTIWPKLSHGFYVLVVVTCCITLSTLYILIGLAARRHAIRKLGETMSVGLDGKTKRNTLSRDIVLQQQSSTSCDKDESSVGSNTSQDTIVSVVSDGSSKVSINTKNTRSKPTNTSGAHDALDIKRETDTVKPETPIAKPEFQKTKHCHIEAKHTVESKACSDYITTNESSRKDSASSVAPILPTASTKGRNSHCLLMGKTTRMLLTTSVTYIVSYMTTITILLLMAATTLLDHPTLAGAVLINFFVVFYLINSAANPIIYSICNPNFRHDCVLMFKQCCVKYCKI